VRDSLRTYRSVAPIILDMSMQWASFAPLSAGKTWPVQRAVVTARLMTLSKSVVVRTMQIGQTTFFISGRGPGRSRYVSSTPPRPIFRGASRSVAHLWSLLDLPLRYSAKLSALTWSRATLAKGEPPKPCCFTTCARRFFGDFNYSTFVEYSERSD